MGLEFPRRIAAGLSEQEKIIPGFLAAKVKPNEGPAYPLSRILVIKIHQVREIGRLLQKICERSCPFRKLNLKKKGILQQSGLKRKGPELYINLSC